MYTTNFCQQGSLGFKFFNSFLLLIISLMLFSSCKVTKTPSLLKFTSRDTTINNFVNNDFELKIQKNDVLSINVSSLNPEDDRVFNAAVGVSGLGANDAMSSGNGYHVSLDGYIYMHRLGNLQVAGLTRKELKLKLEKELQPYFKDPIATVNFENHRITLLGQISKPQILNVPTEKISIFDAIAASGNVTELARLNDVTVIRETTGTKEFKHLNLTDYSIFSSPWYYLQPNDIVLVHPDEVTINQDKKRLRNQQALSVTLQVITIAIIVFQNFFKK